METKWIEVVFDAPTSNYLAICNDCHTVVWSLTAEYVARNKTLVPVRVKHECQRLFCTLCKKYINIEDCVEVEAGLIQHESDHGYIHYI